MIDLDDLAERLHDSGCSPDQIATGILVAELVTERYADMLVKHWTRAKLASIRQTVLRSRRARR